MNDRWDSHFKISQNCLGTPATRPYGTKNGQKKIILKSSSKPKK
jgi:hypothetical protein